MFTLNPSSSDFLNSLEFLIKVIVGGGGLILFYVGFRRYIKAQTWKKMNLWRMRSRISTMTKWLEIPGIC